MESLTCLVWTTSYLVPLKYRAVGRATSSVFMRHAPHRLPELFVLVSESNNVAYDLVSIW